MKISIFWFFRIYIFLFGIIRLNKANQEFDNVIEKQSGVVQNSVEKVQIDGERENQKVENDRDGVEKEKEANNRQINGNYATVSTEEKLRELEEIDLENKERKEKFIAKRADHINPCERIARCSHDCFSGGKYELLCFCYGQSSETYCLADTLVIYGNSTIGIIGGYQGSVSAPGDPTFYFERVISGNFTDVTAVTYNTRDAQLIIVDEGKYITAYDHKADSSRLIYRDKSGGINRISYDRDGNNIYFINSLKYTLTVMSMTTYKAAVLIRGDSSKPVPVDIALFPEIGYMFIMWYTEMGAKISARSMSGIKVGKEEWNMEINNEIVPKGHSNLHLIAHKLQICGTESHIVNMLYYDEDKLHENYFAYTKLQKTPDGGWNEIGQKAVFKVEGANANNRSLTSLYAYTTGVGIDDLRYFATFTNDGSKFRVLIFVNSEDVEWDRATVVIEPSMFTENNYKIYAIPQIYAHHKYSRCYHNNGYCAHICFSTPIPYQSVCRCADNVQDVKNSTTCETTVGRRPTLGTTVPPPEKLCIERESCDSRRADDPLKVGIVLILIFVIILLTITVIKQFS